MAITKKLRARINDLEAVIEEMETSPEIVRVRELEGKIQGYEEAIEDRDTQIANRDETLSGMMSQIDSLAQQLSDMSDQRDALQEQLDERTLSPEGDSGITDREREEN